MKKNKDPYGFYNKVIKHFNELAKVSTKNITAYKNPKGKESDNYIVIEFPKDEWNERYGFIDKLYHDFNDLEGKLSKSYTCTDVISNKIGVIYEGVKTKSGKDIGTVCVEIL